jgi:uncharacterized protein YecT (DUF1311 family)
MNPFAFFGHLMFAGLALLTALTSQAISQDRLSRTRHCLSIADINERVDCLETGAAPDPTPAPTPAFPKQQNPTPSFDCRAARTSIERAICGDVTLSAWDSQMGQLFQQSLRLTKDRQSLLEGQRLWLLQREANCSALADTAIWSCLFEMTRSRAAVLARMTNSNAEVTPTNQPPPSPIPTAAPQTFTPGRSSEPVGNANPSSSQAIQKEVRTGTQSGDQSSSLIFVVVLVIIAAIALKILSTHLRRRRLSSKYGEEIANMIMARQVWQGMTEEQLTESWGNPTDVGREVIRAKTRETWKYGQTGKNRFSNRVYLENGIVIGWKS